MLNNDDLTVEERQNQPLIQQLRSMYDMRTQDEQDMEDIRAQLLRSDLLPTASRLKVKASYLHTGDESQSVVLHSLGFCSRHKTHWSRPLSILAAVLILTLLTGSFLAVLMLAQSHQHATTAAQHTPAPRSTRVSSMIPDVLIDSLDMVDENVGWSIMTISGERYGHIITRTTDGGKHWRDVTPSNLTTSTGILPNWPLLHVFNASTAWIGNAQTLDASKPNAPKISPNPSEVFFTTNGGQTWQKSHFPGAGIFLALSFINTNDGWGISSDIVKPQKPGQSPLEIFRTKDGGQTWEKVATTGTPATHIESAEINFINATTGWLLTEGISDIQQGNQMILNDSRNVYVTYNSGKTWQPENLWVSDRQVRLTSMPHFFNDHEGVAVSSSTTGPLPRNVFFMTHDSGRTWTSLPSTPGSASAGLGVSLLDATHWWVIDFSKSSPAIIYTTSDSGQHWITLSAKDFQQVENLDFVSDKIGWALANPIRNSQGTLFKTTDGGLTWTPISYKVIVEGIS